jgi:cytochrome bd-type quinol oxidase subunit 2
MVAPCSLASQQSCIYNEVTDRVPPATSFYHRLDAAGAALGYAVYLEMLFMFLLVIIYLVSEAEESWHHSAASSGMGCWVLLLPCWVLAAHMYTLHMSQAGVDCFTPKM